MLRTGPGEELKLDQASISESGMCRQLGHVCGYALLSYSVLLIYDPLLIRLTLRSRNGSYPRKNA